MNSLLIILFILIIIMQQCGQKKLLKSLKTNHYNTITFDFKLPHTKPITVYYTDDLNGAGTHIAIPYVQFLNKYVLNHKKLYPYPYHPLGRLFEWCAGPSFIGFALLASGLINHLVVADINPHAIACVKKTIKHNPWIKEHVTTYISNNLNSIPRTEKFDTVIGNPPNYQNLNPKHYLYSSLKNDLRPNDLNWKIHKDFYAHIAPYLAGPDSRLFIQEIQPHEKTFYLNNETIPYDIRNSVPIHQFEQMISKGGLVPIDTIPFLNNFLSYINLPNNIISLIDPNQDVFRKGRFGIDPKLYNKKNILSWMMISKLKY